MASWRHREYPGAHWNGLVKWVIARFARGNISAQEERILLPDEQEWDRRATMPIARKMRARFRPVAN